MNFMLRTRCWSLVFPLVALCVGCPSGPDDDDVYMVAVVSAQVTASNNGTAWDADGSAPDPFYVLECGSTSFTSATASNSSAPTWVNSGCTVTYAQLMNKQVIIQFQDEDALSHDSITGRTALELTESAVTRGEGKFENVGGVVEFTLRMTPQ